MSPEPSEPKALSRRHPFWEALSPTVIKTRIENLLAAPDSQALVRALSPVEYTILLKESPETRPALLELAHPKQVRTVLDLDCWQKDALQSPRVLEWLEALQQSGPEVFVTALRELDLELLIATFRKHMRVNATLPIEEEPDPSWYDEVLANELYRVEFLEPDSPVNERLTRLLNTIRLADLELYHGLLQSIMWGQDSEAEEWAYRWKTGRLQDEGFPDYYEALETYILTPLDEPLPTFPTPPEVPGVPESAEESGIVPSYAWSLTPADSPLALALAGDLPDAVQERLQWEMVHLCNRELVADQVDFADLEAVRASLSRVHAYLNIGLEHLGHHDPTRLSSLLTTQALRSIYQVGYTLCRHLHRWAHRLQTHLNQAAGVRRAVPGLARWVLDGLLAPHPEFFRGLESPGDVTYREFLHLQDVHLAAPVLSHLERDPAYRLTRTAA